MGLVGKWITGCGVGVIVLLPLCDKMGGEGPDGWMVRPELHALLWWFYGWWIGRDGIAAFASPAHLYYTFSGCLCYLSLHH